MGTVNLADRLEELSKVLGQPVTLKDPPAEPEQKSPQSVEPQTGVSEGAPATRKNPDARTQNDSEGPVKFDAEEVAPRAPTLAAFDCNHYVIGEPTNEETQFCAWSLVEAYPDNFIGNRNRQFAKPLFDKILEGRVWDFFYLYDPLKPNKPALLFVPSAQFQVFLDEVNSRLGIALTIPSGVQADRFLIRFRKDGCPQPRYLKRTRDVAELDVEPPPVDVQETAVFNTLPSNIKNKWLTKMKLLIVNHQYDKKAGIKASQERKKQDREHMLASAQKLLGLNGSPSSGVVFVCVDVEKIERPPHPVSEIGLAILDTKELKDVPSGPSGSDWWPLIKGHHLRVKEYSGLVNRQYVQGCPGRFDHGTSTFPDKKYIPAAMKEVLQPYIDSERTLVLVGHNVRGDLDDCAQAGFNLQAMQGVSATIDSQTIHQAWRNLTNGRSLAVVLADMAMSHQNLHNAGNDAVYTLRAMVGVAIEDLREKDAKREGKEYKPAMMRD